MFEKNKKYHEKTATFLKALGDIKKSENSIIINYINYEKLEEFTQKLSKSTFKSKTNNKTKIEKIRFLDAITPSGHIFFDNSISDETKNIYLIESKYDVVSNEILQKIRSEAINQKLEFTSFLSPFFPENHLRAIHIPELSTAFIMNNPKTNSHVFGNLKNTKKINAAKFLNSESLKTHKNLLGLYEKTSSMLLDEATKNLRNALEIHDEIEKVYISSMNHKKINKIADKLISTIL